jgi:hypothetical protein
MAENEAPIIVTGLRTGFEPTTPLYQYPQRKEWYEFKKNTFQLALYIRGLQALMKLDQDKVSQSFFQLGGMTSSFY